MLNELINLSHWERITVFILGVVIGTVLGIGGMLLVWRMQNARLVASDAQRSAQFRRIRELEGQVVETQSLAATAMRDERLRLEREFGQYKILLRRADSALAQAKLDLERLKPASHAA